MPFCRECGSELAGAGQFCSACGARSAEIVPADAPRTAPPAAAQSPRPERTYLKASGVLVTSARLVIGNQVYAMRSISSVAFDRSPQRWLGALLWAGTALASLSLTILNFDSGPLLLMGLFAISTAMSMLCWVQGKPRYWAMLHTTGGESRILRSRDRRYIGTVVMAINSAIVDRG